MDLELDLTYVLEKYRLPFCNFIIKALTNLLLTCANTSKVTKIEKYINDNNIIEWIINKNNYISVMDLYRLALANLSIKKLDKNTFKIEINRNENIPNSYTRLYSIISLLEYGSLSIRKCGLLTRCIDHIIDNLDEYYEQFLLEMDK